MENYNYDWFEIVEQQSDERMTFKILDEIDCFLEAGDLNGFMVVNTKKIPEELKPFLSEDTIEPTVPFRYKNKVLLKNDKLSKYLALAKSFKSHYTKKFEYMYIEVLFEKRTDVKPQLSEKPLDLLNLDGMLDESVVLYSCWELFRTHENRALVEQLALQAEEELTVGKFFSGLDGNTVIDASMLATLLSYFMRNALLTVVNASLKKFDKARALLAETGIAPMRHAPMAFIVRYYLELLIVNEKTDILAEFFENEMLRNGYLTHYEIYMQIFIDPGFVCTRTQQIEVVRSRIEDLRENSF